MSYDILKSSTQSPLLFFLTLSSDHLSPATGKFPTVTISKCGGAFASPAGTVSEIGNGLYQVAGNATDTNTLGPLALHATETSSDNCDLVVANIVKFNPQASDMGLTEPSETYPAPTGQASFAALQRGIFQFLWTFKRIGTAVTTFKEDGTTTAMAGHTDTATNATQLTRDS